jgi:hypothetical protein
MSGREVHKILGISQNIGSGVHSVIDEKTTRLIHYASYWIYVTAI